MYIYLFRCSSADVGNRVYIYLRSLVVWSSFSDWKKRVRTSSYHQRQECGLSVEMVTCTRLFLPVLLEFLRRDCAG